MSLRQEHLLRHGLSLVLLPVFLLAMLPLVSLSRWRSWLRRRRGDKPRIFWGTFALLPLKYNSRADRAAGYESFTVVFSSYRLAREGHFDYELGHWLPSWGKSLFLRYAVFLWALWKFDIFQFFYTGRILYGTVLEFWELQILHWAGKRVVVSPYGGDVWLPGRTRDPNRWDEQYLLKERPYLGTRWWQQKVERNVAYCARHADWTLATFPNNDYLRRCDTVFPHWAIDLDQWRFQELGPSEGPVRVVHAPNHRAIKGTEDLIQACDRLRERGYPVELVLVEGMKNDQAKAVYETADIIADQFVMGAFGNFALEAMALGKPVLCYLRSDICHYQPYLKECPIVNTPPDQITANLEKLIADPELRRHLGCAGRGFVEKYHSYAAIGTLFDGIYRRTWFGDLGRVRAPEAAL